MYFAFSCRKAVKRFLKYHKGRLDLINISSLPYVLLYTKCSEIVFSYALGIIILFEYSLFTRISLYFICL